jgi:DNA-binding HxlR family transcriptional regulator
LTAGTLNGTGNEPRTGAQALALLAVPLNLGILRSLATGPKRPVELGRESGSPAEDTLRARLKALEAIGAVARQRRSRLLGSREYELAEPGRQLRFVAVALERWLAGAPEEPLELGEDAAGAAIEALLCSWSSTMLRALATGPLALSDPAGPTGARDRPSPERCLAALRLAGMVEPASAGNGDAPYAATDWLRRGIGPIVAGSRWERDNLPAETAPIARLDAETVLLMAVPLLQLPPGLSGACRLAIELTEDGEAAPAEVTVVVERSRILSCASPGAGAGTWATGPPASWFRAAIEADPDHLEMGGDLHLVRSVVDGLYEVLFGRSGRSQIRMP